MSTQRLLFVGEQPSGWGAYTAGVVYTNTHTHTQSGVQCIVLVVQSGSGSLNLNKLRTMRWLQTKTKETMTNETNESPLGFPMHIRKTLTPADLEYFGYCESS